jgi:hypothetical protein
LALAEHGRRDGVVGGELNPRPVEQTIGFRRLFSARYLMAANSAGLNAGIEQ